MTIIFGIHEHPDAIVYCLSRGAEVEHHKRAPEINFGTHTQEKD